MKTIGLVSIITPAFNVAHYLTETINSVIAQTYPHWELVVVDDESEDNTAEMVQSFVQRDSRIKYVWQKNGKQGKARNRGLQEAQGEYIAFLDADDVWLPNKLEQQLTALKNQQVDLVFGHAYFLNGSIKTSERTGRGKGKYQGEEAVALLLYNEAFVMSTVLARQEIIFAVGCFETDLAIQYCEDWHMWLNLALYGFSFYSDGEPVSYYRLHSASAAKVEQQAKVKFFLALFNLCQRYTKHVSLKEETKKRGHNLVFHQDSLTNELVSTILKLYHPNNPVAIFFLKKTHTLSSNLFRKFFLYFNKR